MEDLIRRSDAIKAVEECLKLLARPRYTVKTAIEAIPSVDIPHSDDWEKYSDRLWKNAYERGKADRPQDWIPCSEMLPRARESVLIAVNHKYGDWVGEGCYWETTDNHIIWKGYRWNATYWNDEIIAWMPLPKPWKGEDDGEDIQSEVE